MLRAPFPSAVKTVTSENKSAEVPDWFTPIPVWVITYWPFRLELVKLPPRGWTTGLPEPQPSVKKTLVNTASNVAVVRTLHPLTPRTGFIDRKSTRLNSSHLG